LIGLAASSEPGDEIAERTVGEAEVTSDVGQGTPVQEEGTQGFVVALLGLARIAKELLAARVVHDRPSKVSLHSEATG